MIFDLFKSKPTLKKLIANGFIDIHSHILPGIDDGAKDLNESKILIEKMRDIGFSKIIGTPHTYHGLFDNTKESINNAFVDVKNLNIENIEIEFGTEYMLDESIIKKARNKSLICIKDNFVLVEMSYLSEPIGLFEIIYEIKVNGFTPVLAHPERYLFIQDFKKYFKLKKYGCLFQANLLSLTDYYGTNVRERLHKLIDKNLVDFFGSDIHGLRHISGFNKNVRYKKIETLNRIIENNKQFN